MCIPPTLPSPGDQLNYEIWGLENAYRRKENMPPHIRRRYLRLIGFKQAELQKEQERDARRARLLRNSLVTAIVVSYFGAIAIVALHFGWWRGLQAWIMSLGFLLLVQWIRDSYERTR